MIILYQKKCKYCLKSNNVVCLRKQFAENKDYLSGAMLIRCYILCLISRRLLQKTYNVGGALANLFTYDVEILYNKYTWSAHGF